MKGGCGREGLISVSGHYNIKEGAVILYIISQVEVAGAVYSR
jgi:hypothetical protein